MDGLLLIDKPAGPTSHDLVGRVRRAAGIKRVGHAGTLDPAATGLLPVVLGVATRLVRFLPGSPKCYEGTLRLGVRTASDDLAGAVTSRHDGPLPDASAVTEAAAALVGRIRQRPPVVSAKKIGGRRSYRLARQGRPVDPPAVEVDVFRFALAPSPGAAGEWRFEAEVGGGTYIRALARDLGEALGCGGALATLRRTAIGPLRVADAGPPPDDAEGVRAGLLPPERMPLEPPALILSDDADARRFVHGLEVPAEGAGLRRVLDPAGARLLGIGEVTDGRLRPRVVLARSGAL